MSIIQKTNQLILTLQNKFDIWDNEITQDIKNYYKENEIDDMTKADLCNVRLSSILNIILLELVKTLDIDYNLSDKLLETITDELKSSIWVEFTNTYMQAEYYYNSLLKDLINQEVTDENKQQEIEKLFSEYNI